MSHYSGSGDRHKTQRLFFLTTRYLAFLSFPFGIGGAILAYSLIHFLYGHEFIGAQRPLQVLFLSSIITTVANPGAAILYGYEKQSFIYKLGFIMAAFNILLDIFLIKRYGAIGAAAAYSATTVIGTTIGTIYTCRLMKLRYPFTSLFKILFATIIMAVAMEIIILQNYQLLGFILAVVCGAAIYIVCALVLGTFEEEDYTVMRSVANVLPGNLKNAALSLIRFISSFKNGNA
jgi:O-antigen/teichoic acid export membrane protein